MSKLITRAGKWKREQGLHGPQAFFKFIIFSFVQRLNLESKDFVLKGGNLLWVYIKTPRPTVDLDFSTLSSGTHDEVRRLIERVCENPDPALKFSVEKFKEVGEVGAAVTIRFVAEGGAANRFDIDIVYKAPVDTTTIPSPVGDRPDIVAASIENIIADKLAAAWRFVSGNTRLKDYDDLWRIAQSGRLIDRRKLSAILSERSIEPKLLVEWVSSDMQTRWTAYSKVFKDLPADLKSLMIDVNKWLQ
jgi:hypothetical protein